MVILKKRIVFLLLITLLLAAGCGMSRQYETYGQRSYSLGNYEDSADQYERALSANPNNKNALLMVGWTYFKLERYDDARQSFERLNELDRVSVDAFEGLGWTYFKLGRYKESLETFEAIRKKDKLHTGAIEGIAYNYFKMGNLAKAKEYLNIALIENPNSSDSHLIFGFVALRESDFPAAIRFFEKAHRLSIKKDPDLYAGMGNAYLGSKDYNRADYCYNRALELSFKNQLAIAGKGQIFTIKQAVMAEGARLLAEGNLNAAIEEYTKVEKIYPDWPEVYAAKGWALYKKGDYKEVYAEFTKGLQRYKLSYDIYDGLGWCFLKLGQADDAQQSFRKALEIFPGYLSSQEGLKQLKK